MKTEEKARVDRDEIDCLVREYWHLVSVTVRRYYPHLSDSDREEVEGAGYLALTQAAIGYDKNRCNNFRTHAIARIRYAAQEAALFCAAGAFAHRRLERWADLALLPRCVPLEASPGGESAEGEGRQTFSDLIPSACPDIAQTITDGEAARSFWQMIEEALPEKHSAILRGHYVEGKNFRQIAEVRGISHQRIGQLHRNALNTLRAKLSESLSN